MADILQGSPVCTRVLSAASRHSVFRQPGGEVAAKLQNARARTNPAGSYPAGGRNTPLVIHTPLVPCQALTGQATMSSESYSSTTMRTRSNKGGAQRIEGKDGGNSRNEETNQPVPTKSQKHTHTQATQPRRPHWRVVQRQSRRRVRARKRCARNLIGDITRSANCRLHRCKKLPNSKNPFFSEAQWLISPTNPAFKDLLRSLAPSDTRHEHLDGAAPKISPSISHDPSCGVRGSQSILLSRKCKSTELRLKQKSTPRSTAAPLPTPTGGQFAAD